MPVEAMGCAAAEEDSWGEDCFRLLAPQMSGPKKPLLQYQYIPLDSRPLINRIALKYP